MKVTCVGAAGTVTGSNFLVEAKGVRILIDCGMFQGSRHLEERNFLDFPYDPGTISHLLLTHAHIDHCGLIPKLVKHGFTGSIISTYSTADLCEIMLRDSAHIQETEAEWRNRKKKRAGRHRLIEALYTQEDAKACMDYFRPMRYNHDIVLSPQARVRLVDAGHILGSAIIELWIKEDDREVKLVFSGDLGSGGQPIIRDPVQVEDADVLFIESTYGDRLHKSKESTYQELMDVIIAAHQDGGNVIIPAFALERTQEVLYVLSELYMKNAIPYMDIYVDSPLAISATEIFLKHPECFDEATLARLKSGDHPLDFPGMHFTRSTEESMSLNQKKGGNIIIAASGMAHAGRIKHHLRYNLWRPQAHVVFVGYQAFGTTGRAIVDGAKRVKIFGEEVAVNAKVHTIGGFSAHADQQGLLNWIERFTNKPQALFLVHGEPKSSQGLQNRIKAVLGLDSLIPELGEVVDIDVALGRIEEEGIVVPVRHFDEEIDITWQNLDDIIARIGDLDDITDYKVRESLSPKIQEINQQLEEIRHHLAGKEIAKQ